MRIEVREDSVFITGYVNAVERLSKPITEHWRGKVRTFLEKIKAGVFRTALKRNDDVKVLLNHDANRELATTKDGSAKLEEDNIGLRAEVTITDKDVVEKARQNKLVGWSFGFYANSDYEGKDGESDTRTITDLDLVEVSILDDTRTPAYFGTSIEARSVGGRKMEIREVVEEQEQEQKETVAVNIEELAELVANKVFEKINATVEEKAEEEEPAESVEDDPNEEPEEKPAEDVVEEESVEDDPAEEEERAIDYSDFEQRLANIK
jgi:HK97 family phage prohead protease